VDKPYLSNIAEDGSMSGVVHKVLKEGANDVGKTHADFKPAIEVRSAGIDKKHCLINYSEADDETMVYPN